MKKSLPFTKMVASGNDFVVIDNRKREASMNRAWVKKICEFHTGVGADGVLLIEPSRKAAFRMRIMNSDGSEAEACGNGFRCVASFAREKLKLTARFKFESQAGLVQATIRGNNVQVALTDPHGYRKGQIEALGRKLHYSFINTGVPHAVIFVQGLDAMEIEALGRAIRYHAEFASRGANVNFVEIKGRHEINVRTYERGVERETLACGTGSTASVLVSALAGYVSAPVRVKTKSGEILTIGFERKGHKLSNVTLEGEVHKVYEGTLNGLA